MVATGLSVMMGEASSPGGGPDPASRPPSSGTCVPVRQVPHYDPVVAQYMIEKDSTSGCALSFWPMDFVPPAVAQRHCSNTYNLSFGTVVTSS